MSAVPSTPNAPGISMTAQSAETWVVVSALVTGGVYAYRRMTETPVPGHGTLKQVAGSGQVVETGQFVTAWGFTFLVVSMLAEASPGLGGGFALLIMAADVLTNALSIFSDVGTIEAGDGTPVTSTAASAGHAGGSPVPDATSSSGTGGVGQVTGTMLTTDASKYGWNSQQIADWKAVITRESGGNPAARNSGSGAFGVGQFLGSTLQEYAPEGATSTQAGPQTEAMADYIHSRYGNPAAALQHEDEYGWY